MDSIPNTFADAFDAEGATYHVCQTRRFRGRWERNVRSPDVQKLRGALDPHERGLLITTSEYETGARTEATLPNRQPIGLMGGGHLIDLLIEHQIGVKRENPDLLEAVDFAGELEA